MGQGHLHSSTILLIGFLSSTSVHSLSVHPVQLYESLGCLLAALFLYNSRKKLRSNGSLFYLSGLTYYAVRFITEFFRDPSAHALPVPSGWGLNTIQWLMLALIFISALIILRKEHEPSGTPEKKTASFTFRYVIYFLLLGVVFFFSSKWLRATEILVVCLVLFPTALYLGTKVFTSLTIPRLRIASLTLIFLSFVLMSQTYPEQATSDSTLISYNTISIGGLYGQQNFTIDSETVTDCSGIPTTIPGRQYDNTYTIGALGFSRTIQKAMDKSFTFGLSGFIGEHKESLTVRSSPPFSGSTQYEVFGLNPYIQSDGRIVGFGIGAHLGDFTILEGDADTSSVKTINAYPQVYFRIGMLSQVFGELSLARNLPGSFPGTYFQTNIGFGFDKNNANSGAIKFGTSTSTAFFASSYIPIGKQFVMEPYLGFGGSFLLKGFTSEYDKTTGFVGSMNLHYKFNKKPRPKR